MTADGTLRFRKRRSNGTIYELAANGFYAGSNRLVIGRLEWNGLPETGAGQFRLWDGSQFVNVGVTVSTGSGSIGGSSTSPFVIGNAIDRSNLNFDAAWHGSIFAMWATKPGLTAFDDSYLLRYT